MPKCINLLMLHADSLFIIKPMAYVARKYQKQKFLLEQASLISNNNQVCDQVKIERLTALLPEVAA